MFSSGRRSIGQTERTPSMTREPQRLYEARYITYMRTDGIDMAPEACRARRCDCESTLQQSQRAGDGDVPARALRNRIP